MGLKASYGASSLSMFIGNLFIWGKGPILVYLTASWLGWEALLLLVLIATVMKLKINVFVSISILFDCVLNKFDTCFYLTIAMMLII